MQEITELSRKELADWFEKRGIRPFRAGQVFKWIYLRQADRFSEMTDLGKDLRTTLEDAFTISRLSVESVEASRDGTRKFLFRLTDGNRIESVLIPQKDHYTLCISSQAGCAQGCRFCLTARFGFNRNLTSSEIIAQVRDVRRWLEKEVGADARPLSNLVFMGMGEPLANYDAMLKAITVITDGDFGLKFSTRRVTVSTCGLVPEILKLGQDADVNLAVSLNATDDETRSMLMPINRRYPIRELLEACRDFRMKPRNKITFEYILIQGVNDSEMHARQLAKLLAPIRAKVNLIAFNTHERSEFRRPSKETVSRFLQILLDRGMTAIVRKSMGDDISAACGQLKARHSRNREDLQP